jgi:hypothetical protein
MPKNELQSEMLSAWRSYLDALETALERLEREIDEAQEMASVCTDEWCEATEHFIDELSNSLFSISEPRWAEPADSDRIKKLKKRVYDLYSGYKRAYENAA